MKRILAIVVFCALVLGCAGSTASLGNANAETYIPPAGSVVLRIEVISAEFTDMYSGCDERFNCIPTHYWYKYRARVKEVIAGEWAQHDVEFIHLQHAAYIDEVTRDCYVVLRPTSVEIQAKGKSLVADKLLSNFWKPDRAAIKALRNGT
jgi:hypothetical protein